MSTPLVIQATIAAGGRAQNEDRYGRSEGWRPFDRTEARLREQTLGPRPVKEGGTVTREERLVVAEGVHDAHSLGLCNDIRPHALADQLKRAGEPDSAFLPVAPGDSVIDTGRQAV